MTQRYTQGDLTPLEDGIELIRRNPEKFLYPLSAPSGNSVMARVTSTLIFLGSYPLHVEVEGNTWAISSGRDWLMDANGTPDYIVFSQLVAFPEYCKNSYREEVLISAFSENAATFSPIFGLRKIKGHIESFKLSQDYFNQNPQYQRTLVFSIGSEA